MPQLNRVSVISSDQKVKRITDLILNITPVPPGFSSPLVNMKTVSGVLSLSSGTYNVTPNITFAANVMVWGAGGANSTGNGGAGGFSTGAMVFSANVSYNVVVGAAGTSGGGGGGGSGIEYIANSNPIIIAGGGGGGGSGSGGAGGGWQAANSSPAGGNGATAFTASSPGSYKIGGPSAGAVGLGAGGAGAGGGGGGLYGGGSGPAGGGGGGAFIDTNLVYFSNTQTGSNTTPPFSTYSRRATAGDGGVASPFIPASSGLIVISVL